MTGSEGLKKIKYKFKLFFTQGVWRPVSPSLGIFINKMTGKQKGIWVPEAFLKLNLSYAEVFVLSIIYGLYKYNRQPVYCYMKYIANLLGCSPITVKRCIKRLKDEGYLKITKGEKRNLYEVDEDKINPIKDLEDIYNNILN